MPTPAFDQRLDDAIAIAQKYSGFSQFHPTYPPLFKRIWCSLDTQETGFLTLDQCEEFAGQMVAAGWNDWAPSSTERDLWEYCDARTLSGVQLEHFAEISENGDNFDKHQVPRRVSPGAMAKAEAGGRMAAAFSARQGSSLPNHKVTRSQMTPNHCTSCEHQPMCQHPYCGPCEFCKGKLKTNNISDEEEDPDEEMMFGGGRDELLSYQRMCGTCAEEMGRCTGCAGFLS